MELYIITNDNEVGLICQGRAQGAAQYAKTGAIPV